ncbi:MAG TPA: hypothetical protein VGG72_14895 [Bryobacteraceae bacterium]|jgi:hypothetical protein
MISPSAALYLTAMLFQAGPPPGSAPIIDNERTTVWDTSAPHACAHDCVAIALADGKAVFGHKGAKSPSGGRTVVIELKDFKAAPPSNKTAYPNAFPRPGSKKLIENDRVIVWDYTWTTGVATPMHYHDKDVVVTYLKDGALKSTTPSGDATVNEYKFGTVKYNPRDRTHTETLVKGSERAIIVEFK